MVQRRSTRPLPTALALALTVTLGAGLVAGLPARSARADTPTAPNPAAVAAFDEGRRLMSAGDTAGAIAKFEQSVRATRTVGALLNLGKAYEKAGREASAWATFRGAAALARELHDRREADAETFAKEALPKVSHVVVDGSAVAGVAGVEITCDGSPVAPGEPIPVDAGTSTIAVHASGKLPWTTSVEVPPAGARATVRVPALQDAPVVAEPAGPAPAGPKAPDASPPATSGGGQRTLGFTLGGVGLVTLGAGGVFGLLAIAAHGKATSACPDYPNHCPSSGAADGPNRDAQTFATVSTATFIAGGVLALGGAVLVFTAPRGPAAEAAGATGSLSVRPMVSLGGAGARAEWTF